MPSQSIDISIQLSPLPGRPRLTIEGSALICYDLFHSPDQEEHLLRINNITLTSATVNDELLSEEELIDFEQQQGSEYWDELECLALSSVP